MGFAGFPCQLSHDSPFWLSHFLEWGEAKGGNMLFPMVAVPQFPHCYEALDENNFSGLSWSSGLCRISSIFLLVSVCMYGSNTSYQRTHEIDHFLYAVMQSFWGQAFWPIRTIRMWHRSGLWPIPTFPMRRRSCAESGPGCIVTTSNTSKIHNFLVRNPKNCMNPEYGPKNFEPNRDGVSQHWIFYWYFLSVEKGRTLTATEPRWCGLTWRRASPNWRTLWVPMPSRWKWNLGSLLLGRWCPCSTFLHWKNGSKSKWSTFLDVGADFWKCPANLRGQSSQVSKIVTLFT